MTAAIPTPVCPICSAPHAACLPTDPRYVLDVPPEARRPVVAELHLYEVPIRNSVTQMRLTEEDAKLHPGAKKLGKAKQVEVQPVSRPPHATNASDVTERPELPEDEAEPAEHLVTSQGAKKAEAPQNKARTANPRRG
jgi:hypothetical protein